MKNTHNRIDLIFNGRREEGVVATAFGPGHLLQQNSDMEFLKDDSAFPTEVLIAFHDILQGKTVEDNYAADDFFQLGIPKTGDVVYLRLAAGAAAVSEGNQLVPDGTGCVAMVSNSDLRNGLLYRNVAASAAHTASTDEALFDKSYSIPANSLRVGDIIRVKAQVIATATNSTDTLTLKLYIGGLAGTAICTTGAIDVANGDVGYIEADIVIRTIGASGTFVASGSQALGVPGTVTAKPFLLGSTAIDTTAAKVIGVGADWSSTNAGNSARLDVLDIELVRLNEGKHIAVALADVDNSLGITEEFIKCRIAA